MRYKIPEYRIAAVAMTLKLGDFGDLLSGSSEVHWYDEAHLRDVKTYKAKASQLVSSPADVPSKLLKT